MKDRYLDITKNIVLNSINRNEISVFLFGSRVGAEPKKSSDVDIGFISNSRVKRSIFRKIIDRIDESRIPYHVDLIDFTNADKQFKKYAMKRIIIWNRGKYLS